MSAIFRKIAKAPAQNLSIICKDSIQQLFWKIHQKVISVIPKKTLIIEFHFSKPGCCKSNFTKKSIPSQIIFFGVWQIFSE